MLRQSFARSSRSLARSARPFSVSTRIMAEGDLGSGGRGGQQGDAFVKRERASEEIYVREQERNKLKLLQSKLREQRKNIDDLDKDIASMLKEEDGDKKN